MSKKPRLSSKLHISHVIFQAQNIGLTVYSKIALRIRHHAYKFKCRNIFLGHTFQPHNHLIPHIMFLSSLQIKCKRRIKKGKNKKLNKCSLIEDRRVWQFVTWWPMVSSHFGYIVLLNKKLTARLLTWYHSPPCLSSQPICVSLSQFSGPICISPYLHLFFWLYDFCSTLLYTCRGEHSYFRIFRHPQTKHKNTTRLYVSSVEVLSYKQWVSTQLHNM